MSSGNTRTAVITGGSGGIGAAVRQSLLAQGYSVVNLDRAPCADAHPALRNIEIDLMDTAALRGVAARLAAEYAVTSLVHNAGVIRPALVPEVRLEDYEALSRLHVGALIVLGQAFLPAMQAAQFGRIVTVSTRAVLGLETRTAYSATKAAQIGLTRTWALELGRYGVTVNAIAPGPIVTDQFRALIPAEDPRNERIAASLPARRLGTPEDIARVALFLLAPESGFITGQTWFVCGGASIGSVSYT
jgi:NAD(P)-dependent dehydrogenase (short-subunit alcohol dehydrogenase family)